MPPNFLIVMSDEHDPRVSSPYGHPFVETPSLQRLADRGVVFEHAYCNSPLCTPSRASFMTGKHVHQIGVWDNGVPLASDEPTWAHRLNAVGYETALAGKMHFIGPDQRHGFQRRLVPDIHSPHPQAPPDWREEVAPPGPEMRRRFDEAGAGDSLYQQYDDEVARASVAYLAEPARRERPWALCASFITPHFPLVARPAFFETYYPDHADLPEFPAEPPAALHPHNRRLRRYFDCANLSEEQIRRARAAYYGLVTFCDARVGMVLDALEASGLAEDTVVAYLSDHGEMIGQHGLWWKCTFYEGSTRIPLVVSWPKRFAPGRRGQVTSTLDLVRSMLELAGAELEGVEGTSLVGLLDGQQPDGDGLAIAEYAAHGTTVPGRMVRRGRFKLNYYLGEPPELFDLATDRHELVDLAEQPAYAAVREELTAIALDGWDPVAVDRRVRASQARRRILARGAPTRTGEGWAPGAVADP